MKKKLSLIISLIFIFFSCEKELDINDFSDDFSFYEPELRIEAIIYPSQNTALVRVDKSIRIDEADLFDCIDNDLDWNYYYCEENNQSFESSDECIDNCEGEDSCELHLYACKNFETEDSTSSTLFTFPDKISCIENCQWSCITDDTGTDGFLTPEEGHGPGFIQPDDDGSENNGLPDCNEPNIDEYDEILPNVHVKDCEIKMTNSGNICNFVYNENAGEFYEYNGMKINFDIEVINYGGFIPDSSCSEFNFKNYETEYELIIDCSENSEFSRYGLITATDIIKKPPVVFHPNKTEDIINCTNSEEIHECLLLNSLTENDTLIFLSDYIPDFNEPYTNQLITHDDIILTLQNMDLLDTNLLFVGNDEAKLYFSALFETSKFQSVQYYWDEIMEKFIYVHGHPDGITDSGENYYDENICILSEAVVPEQIQGKFRFKYDFFTFSKGFENYYFLDQLDLSDPIRTNIRDENGNPVMGGFGSMASDIINFVILTPDNIIDLILTQN
ncbi:MAG: hypothetical protein H8E60_00310 [Candidatus Marinimicrobia bacterium]|nr:hypothetical protein [Candidatus Neomarinimicrobiota bacterium]